MTTTISTNDIKRLLDAEKLKYCFECGICTASCSVAELLGEHYNPRILLEKIFLTPEEAIASQELWLCAWCYRCYKRCPQSLKLPEIFLFFRTMALNSGYTKPLEKALQKVVENIPLPLVTTALCFHPERTGLNVEEILEKLRRLRARSIKAKRDKMQKVAVVGSGPAGLAVAHDLACMGYNVTVFESLSEPGGMLRKCIPKQRLPRDVLDEEIQFIKSLGVKMQTGVYVGKDINFGSLWKEGYKAIFIGCGAQKAHELKIEGADLAGVFHALDFLWHVNSDKDIEIGKNVVVIGGGNTAIDSAKTASQLGAQKTTILYRRSKEEMPANPWEVKEIEKEGMKIEFLTAPKRILGKNGRVSAIECVRMQLGELDATGRRKPVPIEGSEHIIEADMVILAVGEAPDVEFLPKEIEVNEDGTIWANPITMETTVEGVFAGGDAVRGPSTVIEAIRDGKIAATSIDRYLKMRRAGDE